MTTDPDLGPTLRRPRGVLLGNVWGRVDDARALLRAGDPIGEDPLA